MAKYLTSIFKINVITANFLRSKNQVGNKNAEYNICILLSMNGRSATSKLKSSVLLHILKINSLLSEVLIFQSKKWSS